MGIYNRLVRLRALVKEGFSGITVQLSRRADLIPNLVETVQGYATHEREVFEEVSKARAASVNAGSVAATAQADAQMTGLLGRLFAVAEAYPELKANTNFLQLQDQLASIEGELQSARRYYNATVRDLNSTIQSFPPVVIARPMGFTEEPFYQDDDPAIQSAPKVILRQTRRPDMRRAWRALPALFLIAAPAPPRGRAHPALFERRPDPEGQHRSTSPKRSMSAPRTTGSTTASTATSRPTIAGRNGSQVRVGFTFEGATLDGMPVPAKAEPLRQWRSDQGRRPGQDRRRRRAQLRPPLPHDPPDRPLRRL